MKRNQFLEEVAVEEITPATDITSAETIAAVEAEYELETMVSDFNVFENAIVTMKPDMGEVAIEAFGLLLNAPAAVIGQLALEEESKADKIKAAFSKFIKSVQEWFSKNWAKVKKLWGEGAKKAIDGIKATEKEVEKLGKDAKKLVEQDEIKAKDVIDLTKDSDEDEKKVKTQAEKIEEEKTKETIARSKLAEIKRGLIERKEGEYYYPISTTKMVKYETDGDRVGKLQPMKFEEYEFKLDAGTVDNEDIANLWELYSAYSEELNIDGMIKEIRQVIKESEDDMEIAIYKAMIKDFSDRKKALNTIRHLIVAVGGSYDKITKGFTGLDIK